MRICPPRTSAKKGVKKNAAAASKSFMRICRETNQAMDRNYAGAGRPANQTPLNVSLYLALWSDRAWSRTPNESYLTGEAYWVGDVVPNASPFWAGLAVTEADRDFFCGQEPSRGNPPQGDGMSRWEEPTILDPSRRL